MPTFAWQAWQLELPPRWDPVKLEGDFDSGLALITDTHGPRLGLRWKKEPRRKRFDPAALVRRAMREEVGVLAAEEAKPFAMPCDGWLQCKLYEDPEPPGRDVWVGYSGRSDRLLQIAYHAQRRDNVLSGQILAALGEHGGSGRVPWSVFDLSCRVPAGFRLDRHRLNAGDLSLTFSGQRRVLSVRQLAVAHLALRRMPLARWLAGQQSRQHRYFRRDDRTEPVEITAGSRTLAGVGGTAVRRRRFFWMRWLPPAMVTCALHDPDRDRLVIVEGSDRGVVMEAAASVGCLGYNGTGAPPG